ncbi:hypothetical protein COD83_05885 [Bacillus thuringiensis]|nr:hypothetical protein bcere0005_51850 [Bacillus cereus 172560W]PGV82009.1 hypothetical protein COD83_05885 [Bacillus thuringiensis]
MECFSKLIKKGKIYMDLFNLEVKESMLHSNFKYVEKDADLREVLNSWSIGFEDRDNKFVKEFQTTFNSSFWELYLHACFKNLGFKIDYSHHAPDFYLKSRRTKAEILVEAVATNNPREGLPEHERLGELIRLYEAGDNREEIHSEIVHLATERISSSIKTKSEKYENSYSKMEHVQGKPFILAVGSFEQPLSSLQGTAAIQRVLYGLTKAEYIDSKPHFEYTDHILKKGRNAQIPVGIFNDNKYSYISGILFNPVASSGKARALSLNKHKDIIFETRNYNNYDTEAILYTVSQTKYKESLLDGTSLYLNPYAENPINIKDFDNPDIAINFDKENVKMKHNFLFSRTVINVKGESKDTQLI